MAQHILTEAFSTGSSLISISPLEILAVIGLLASSNISDGFKLGLFFTVITLQSFSSLMYTTET